MQQHLYGTDNNKRFEIREHLDPFLSKQIQKLRNLVFRDLEQSDAGEYIFQAENVVGTRESNRARLSVYSELIVPLVKPYCPSDPMDVTVNDGNNISLECEVGGEPKLTWTGMLLITDRIKRLK